MATPVRRYVDFLDTPLGRFAIIVDREGRLMASGFASKHARMERELAETDRNEMILRKNPGGVTAAVARYFAGDLDALAGIALALAGTPFQLAVWHALAQIPPSETRTYTELASAIGRPSAVRAVGLANGANPAGLVLPCHRVIGANGSLVGYAGGVARKQWLLGHEARHESQGSGIGSASWTQRWDSGYCSKQ